MYMNREELLLLSRGGRVPRSEMWGPAPGTESHRNVRPSRAGPVGRAHGHLDLTGSGSPPE